MRTSRLIVGLALIAVAVFLLIFGEGNYSTAGVVVFAHIGAYYHRSITSGQEGFLIDCNRW